MVEVSLAVQIKMAFDLTDVRRLSKLPKELKQGVQMLQQILIFTTCLHVDPCWTAEDTVEENTLQSNTEAHKL